MRALTKPAEGR